MTTRIEEFVAYLGWEVDDKDLKEFDKQVQGVTDTFKKVALAIGAATAALTTGMVVANKQTAELNNLAKAVGVSTEFLIGMGGVVGEIGFKIRNVVDLIEEMNNKIGEKAGLGKMTAVEESVRMLGLNFKIIKELEPEKQFIRLLDAAKKMEDQQQAVSAIDMLMGGEGNKILGQLRGIEGSLDEIIGRRLELNFLSKDGIDQATRFSQLWGHSLGVVSSVWAQFAGLLGGAISPMLEQFVKIVRQNRKLIKQKVASWAADVGKALKLVFRIFKVLVSAVKTLTDRFGGLRNSLHLLAFAFGALQIFKILSVFQALVPILYASAGGIGAISLALKSLGVPVAVVAILLAALAIEDLYTWFKGGDTVFGAWGESLANTMSDATDDIDEFFGRARGTSRLWISRFADDVGDGVKDAWKHLTWFFDAVNTLDWSEIDIFWTGGAIQKEIQGIGNSLRWVESKASGLYNKLTGGAQGNPTVPRSLTGLTGVASSPLSSQALNNIRKESNTNSRGDTRIDTRNNFRITQLPGESGTDFAKRVIEIQEGQMANAVRNNDTGITR